jgi:hypothetical protein
MGERCDALPVTAGSGGAKAPHLHGPLLASPAGRAPPGVGVQLPPQGPAARRVMAS